ncbi:MAG TPA: hypothetical protein VF179_04070 [Thermoanaerobaculia bacterium]|nr:hypothetical protein [Thermoanaerobaculia bacterium]
MAEPRRGLTAEERFEALQRDRAALRRERLLREVAGPCWYRMVRIVPVFFRREGMLIVRALLAEPGVIAEALKEDAVFALDTAMRLAHGHGFLAIREVHAYLTTLEPLDHLAGAGLISSEPLPDTTLVRPWPGPPRLLACIVEELPPSRQVAGGLQVVTAERLARELIGAVGPRADLFALLETAEAKSSG